MARQTVLPFAPPSVGARGSKARRALRAKALAPRIAPAAVRVPDPIHAAVAVAWPAGTPHIFVHEGARQSLERRLAQAVSRPVVLAVTDNRRNMISFSRRDGILRARIHHMFLDAPSSVQDALVQFLVYQDREASTLVGEYIHQNSHRIRAARPVVRPLQTQGKHHDLLLLYQEINDRYFGGTMDALITWGRNVRRDRSQPRRSIKLGSYSAIERLIRIHPTLDRPWVPRYFVAYIIYHEMLHHLIPASHGTGRRMLHPPEFVARERAFRYFERALAWERAHIRRLLRS